MALKEVEVAGEHRQAAVEAAFEERSQRPAVGQAGEGVALGEHLQLCEAQHHFHRARRLVGEEAQRPQAVVRGKQPVDRLVDPDGTGEHPVGIAQGDVQVMSPPRTRPDAVAPRRAPTQELRWRQTLAGEVVEQRAPVVEMLVGEQRLQLREREWPHGDGGEIGPPGRRARAHDAVGVGQEGYDVMEAEGARDAVADGGRHLVERARAAQRGRHPQQLLDRLLESLRAGRYLALLHRVGDVGGGQREQAEIVWGGSLRADGLVDREHSEQLPGAVAHGDDEQVLGVPANRVPGRRPVRDVRGQQVLASRVKLAPVEVGSVLEVVVVEQACRGSVRPSNSARADSEPCTVTTSRSSQAARCRLMTTVLKPTASASSAAIAGSASDLGRSRATRATVSSVWS